MRGDNPYLEGTKEEFIKNNMKLVYSICNKYKMVLLTYMSTTDYEDLVSLGTMGLLKAYNNFNPSKFKDGEGKFSTYAVPLIQGEIRRYLRDNSIGAKFPRSAKTVYFQIRKANLLEEDPEFIAEKLCVSVEEVHKAMEYYKIGTSVRYLSEVVYQTDGSPITVEDSVKEKVDFNESLIMKDFLSSLKGKCKEAVYLHCCEDKTQEQVAKIMGISQVQVSRYIKNALERASIYGQAQGGYVDMARAISVEPEVCEKIKEMCRNTDLSFAKIGEELGCDKMVVYRVGKKERDKRNLQIPPKTPKYKPPKSGEVTTRKMTEEEMARYGVKKDSNVVSENHSENLDNSLPKKEEVGTTNDSGCLENLVDTQIKKSTNVSMTLNANDLTIEDLSKQFNKLVQALKFADVSKLDINISVMGV